MATSTKTSLKDEMEKLQTELNAIDIEEDFDAYRKKAKEFQKVAKKYNSEKVTIKLPRARSNEDRHVFIGWNGVGYSIERGTEVEVPRAVAEIYEMSEAQKDEAYDLINGLSDEYAKDPHTT